MQNRLSLADLKAKASKVVSTTEIFTGGACEYCHDFCGKFLDFSVDQNKKKG